MRGKRSVYRVQSMTEEQQEYQPSKFFALDLCKYFLGSLNENSRHSS